MNNYINKHRMRPVVSLLALTTACVITLAVSKPVSAQVPSGYSLAWSDEFNGAVGSAPNPANWSYDLGAGGWGNGEWETYESDTTHASIVSDSGATDGKALHIQVTYNAATNSYQSARLKTQGKVSFTYGYIEMRARTTTGLGKWPAFWMLGNSYNGSNWPQCGEMDIMEYIGNSTEQASFHMGTWSDRIDWSASYGTNNPAAYHTYGLLWTSTGVTDYVDGVQFEYHPSSSPGWIFNQPFFFLLNFAVGANAGNPWSTGTPVFPWDYYVDYVRVYEPGSGGGGGGGTGGGGGGGGTNLNGVHAVSPQNTGNNMVLDDPGSNTGNGTQLDIWTNGSSNNQKWNFSNSGVSPSPDYNIAVNLGPYCMDAAGTTSGSPAEIWSCNGSTAESWNVVADASPAGYYQLQPANGPGLCLNVSGSGTANGSKVIVWSCSGSTNAQWDLH